MKQLPEIRSFTGIIRMFLKGGSVYQRRDKMKSQRKTFVYLAIISALFISLAGCKKSIVNSHWTTDAITIDGNPAEWENQINYIEKAGIGLAVANDSENLYFCATTGDENLQRQIMFRGLDLWLDSGGGKAEEYGIRFPLGMAGMDASARREMFQGGGQAQRGQGQLQGRPGDEGQGGQRPNFSRLLDRMTMDFMVMGKKALGSNIPIQTNKPVQVREPVNGNNRGIELKLKNNNGQLTYEGKIPLKEFVDTGKTASNKIGIGVQLAKVEGPSGNNQYGGRGFGGRMGPPGGMRGGPGRMGPPGNGMRPGNNTQQSLDFWGQIVLAKQQ